MNFNAMQEAICVNREVFKGAAEQPIDLDITLPDYCPDISRILKCQILPQITMRQILGDRLNVEGTTMVRILYVDEEGGCVRSCELSSAFSTSFNIKADTDSPLVFTATHVDFVNCRAVTKRRVDIHGAFTVNARVLSRCQEELLNGADGDGVQIRQEPALVSTLVGAAQHDFTISETLELSQNKALPETILRCDGHAVLTDYKAIANKLIAKGELLIKLLYSTDLETGALDVMEYSIPISQILDIDGLYDDCECDVKLEILSIEAKINEEDAESGQVFEIEARACVSAMAHRQQQIQVITDAYSTDYELEVEKRQITFDRVADLVQESFLCKGNVEIPANGIVNIIDTWCDVVSSSVTPAENRLDFSGRVNVCMLVINSEQKPEYLERMLDYSFSKEYPESTEGLVCTPNVDVVTSNYRLSGMDGIELRVELKLSAAVYASVKLFAIAQMQPNEAKPKNKDSLSALTIYYAEPGETLWEIARRYNTSVQAVSNENDLSEDRVEKRTMLLIPVIK